MLSLCSASQENTSVRVERITMIKIIPVFVAVMPVVVAGIIYKVVKICLS